MNDINGLSFCTDHDISMRQSYEVTDMKWIEIDSNSNGSGASDFDAHQASSKWILA